MPAWASAMAVSSLPFCVSVADWEMPQTSPFSTRAMQTVTPTRRPPTVEFPARHLAGVEKPGGVKLPVSVLSPVGPARRPTGRE